MTQLIETKPVGGIISLTDDAQKLLCVIKDNPTLSKKEMSEIVGWSVSKTYSMFKMLYSTRCIYREGTSKKGIWKITQEAQRLF